MAMMTRSSTYKADIQSTLFRMSSSASQPDTVEYLSKSK